jgi:sorting nexin-5/6/32
VAAHLILRKDVNFHVFLEYNQDECVSKKYKKKILKISLKA